MLESRFRALVTDRAIGRFEITGAHSFAADRVARMTDTQVLGELGNHPHVGQAFSFEPAAAGGAEHTTRPTVLSAEHLEGDFWERESLRTIYDAALARMCAPWAVLAHCAARALYGVRPCIRLPALVGGPGSLNWFAVVVAPSGGGKSAAEDVARELVDMPIEQRSLGSGEGFVESYFRPENKQTGESAGQYESIMFLADEGDSVSALSSRSGSTLLSTLRTAWTGRSLSFGYRGRTSQQIAAHTYRTTLIMAAQPTRAAWLLDDSDGGTPQRFMWFPGTDQRITSDGWDGTPLYQLNLPSWREWQYGTELTVPDEARDLILSERAKAARGEQDALDGHALFCREKFAYALTVLDGRTDMTAEDWELSGIAAEVSAYIRDWVRGEIDDAERRDAVKVGALRGVAQNAAKHSESVEALKLARIETAILGKLAGGRMKNKALINGFSSRYRAIVKLALERLADAGLIRQPGDDAASWELVK